MQFWLNYRKTLFIWVHGKFWTSLLFFFSQSFFFFLIQRKQCRSKKPSFSTNIAKSNFRAKRFLHVQESNKKKEFWAKFISHKKTLLGLIMYMSQTTFRFSEKKPESSSIYVYFGGTSFHFFDVPKFVV